MKPKKRLFCYTVVKEFKSVYEVSMARDFLSDLKHEGITDDAIRSLTHTGTAQWTEEDECGTSHHAVEIIERE